MTNRESKTIEQLTSLVSSLIEENKKFRTQITEEVNVVTKKVDKKYSPVNLETEILRKTQESIGAAIQTALTGYSSPLTKLVEEVVKEQNVYLKEIISESFNSVIKTDDFKLSIISGFSHKISRSIISNQSGLFDKVSQELKQDPIFRAKITTAIANVVEECLKEGKIDKI